MLEEGGGHMPPDFAPHVTSRPPRFSDLATSLNNTIY